MAKYLKNADITQEILDEITELAIQGVNQQLIGDRVGFSKKRFTENESIREAWVKGNNEFKISVQMTYAEMVKSGDCWAAMKHFYATQFNIVEPKEKIIVQREETELTDDQALAIHKIMNREDDSRSELSS